MRARHVAEVTVTLSGAGLLWEIRPPLHELATRAPVSMYQLATDAYLLVWLGLLLACLSQPWHLLPRLTPRRAVTSRERLPIRRPRPKAAPLALPLVLPRMMLVSQTRSDLAGPSAKRLTALPTETESAYEFEASDGASVLLLGPLAVTAARAKRHGLRAAALELIAYLALHPHGATRDELLEALWPDQDPRKTRGRLYQATRDARRLLSVNAITRTKENYQLNRALVTVDVDRLADVLEAREHSRGEEERARLERALMLVRGDPLAGCDYAWAASDVRQLRSQVVDLLTRVARARLDARNHVGALEAAERGLKIDEFNEELWRLALSAEGAAGLRKAVEDRYRRLQNTLELRLGLTPSSETRSLYRRLLGQA